MSRQSLAVLALALLTFVGAGANSCLHQVYYLQIVAPEGERVLASFPIKSGDHFFLDYTHSVSKTPVHDVFQVDAKGRIILREESFRWDGAGLEFHPSANIRFTGDWIVVTLERELTGFLLRVGTVSNHMLTINGRTVPLKSLAEEGSLVRLEISKAGYWTGKE